MTWQGIVIRNSDRRRLGTMLERAYAAGMDSRKHLHHLETTLEDAVGIEDGEVPKDVIAMNSTVWIRDLDSGEMETYALVYPECADVTLDRISVLSPIGRAMLGRRTGDIVTVATPSGERRIKIVAVEYKPTESRQQRV